MRAPGMSSSTYPENQPEAQSLTFFCLDLILISLQAVFRMAMMSTPKRSLPDPLRFGSPSLIRKRPSSLLAPFRLVGSVRSLSVYMTDISGVALEVFLFSQCCLSSCKSAFSNGLPHDHHVR